jgi:hypothetical protein
VIGVTDGVIPLTDDQEAAIRELRFVWTNIDHTMSWGLTHDHSVASRCPGGVTAVTKSRNPVVLEYDVMMGHPQAVALVALLQKERKAA